MIKSVLDGTRRQVEAARLLGLSTRQVRRQQRRLAVEGDVAVVHRLRGRPSNNARDATLKQRVLSLYRSDYGPTRRHRRRVRPSPPPRARTI